MKKQGSAFDLRRNQNKMKINIANQQTGQQKTIEIEDEHKLTPFQEKTGVL